MLRSPLNLLFGALLLAQTACAQPAATPSAQAADSDTAEEVPFELVGSRVYVPVTVNGHGPLDFMLDVGASGIGRLDDSLATALNIPVTGQAENFDGVNTSTIDVVAVERLTLGSFTQQDAELMSRNYPDAGIIARGFFEEHLLTIDYPEQEVRWSENTLDASGSHVVGYDTAFRIPVRIGSIETTGSLDTGSSLPMHLPIAYADSLETTELVEAGTGRRANTEFKLYRATILEPVVIAGNTVTDLEVLFSEQAPYVNIGSPFLQQFAVTFDQQNQLIRIAPPVNR